MEEKDYKSLVIEKAKEIFIIYGYKKTTMEDIAKACHKSKGLIYHHYNSKEEIFRIIVNKEITEMVFNLKKNVMEKNTVKDKFTCFFLFINKWFNDNTTNLYHKIIMDIFEYIDFIKDIVFKLHSDVIDIIKEILIEGKKNDLQINNIESTAITILQMMMGFMYTPFKKILNIAPTGEVDIKNYVDIIYNGLKKK